MSNQGITTGGPLLAIVGPTASGKTALALQLAKEHGGEIICADSRTIYRGMDIGTAKPTVAERAEVPHHLLDIIEPTQSYSAAEFQQAAIAVIEDTHRRQKLPILVGGTGLYLWAVLYAYRFPAGPSTSLRTELQQLPLAELVRRLQQVDPERAAVIDLRNSRRVIRALETAGQPQIAPKALSESSYILGLNPGLAELERHIARRTHQMLTAGLVDEVQGLLARYNPVIPPLNTVGYRETIDFLGDSLGRSQLEPLINLHTRQLAKRQLTWFKRNPDIHWAATTSQAKLLAETFLAMTHSHDSGQ
ncbi:MAG TPA: tRNA (adenosine(37)-N6)-dimethylallyltransferase MiaA [Candidatus Saccharimonadales bacterium]|nr:tRNA (adenosine(37)-N6)-dimethylallyltransferase MiaA [Candidatus Saccharimonadales bacterium]